MSSEELRRTFDRVPEIYDRARQTYPDELFDTLFEYIGVDAPSVVEIGPGTGQATRSLLARGAKVTAVEIGPNLAAFLGRKFPDVTVVNSAFEDAELPPGSFDAVVCAGAFHWIDPAVRFSKSRELLRPGGILAVVAGHQIADPIDRGFFNAVFPIYLKYRPDEKNTVVPGDDIVPGEYDDMLASGLFEDVTFFKWRDDQTYSSEAYGDLVHSYSGTLAMDAEAAKALVADLRRAIDDDYGGAVTRPIMSTVTLGRRSGPSR
jgi:SAM-dependent methyltransferase